MRYKNINFYYSSYKWARIFKENYDAYLLRNMYTSKY